MANANTPAANSGNVTDIAKARKRHNKSTAGESDTVKPASTKSAAASTAVKKGIRKFDHEKVAAIKAAIEDGTYSIDPQRVADKFIERESP